MKWNNRDFEKYLSAKEYVDTAIVPLQPVNMSNESKVSQDAFNNELLHTYTNEIEKELSGRVFLIPTYHYLSSANLEDETIRIKSWIDDIKLQPFEHIFLVTFDTIWKKKEKNLPCELIWLPGMKAGNLQNEEIGRMIRTQVEQISELIRAYWS